MMKQSNLKTEIELEAKHCSVRDAWATGIPLTEICNKLLFVIVSMTHLLVFPFLFLIVVNLLFHGLHHFNGSGPRVVAFL